jgi:hypothetical protein
MDEGNETLRWPTSLDRTAIVRRLVQLRANTEAAGLPGLAARFAGVEGMTGGQIGAAVIGALTVLQDKPEHNAIAKQFEMIAVNLKNLK